jgi:hypothetical protein
VVRFAAHHPNPCTNVAIPVRFARAGSSVHTSAQTQPLHVAMIVVSEASWAGGSVCLNHIARHVCTVALAGRQVAACRRLEFGERMDPLGDDELGGVVRIKGCDRRVATLLTGSPSAAWSPPFPCLPSSPSHSGSSPPPRVPSPQPHQRSPAGRADTPAGRVALADDRTPRV